MQGRDKKRETILRKSEKNYPKLGTKRRINIPKQVLKKALEIEPPLMKYIEMPQLMETIHHSLRILQRGVLVPLHLHQEPLHLLNAHHPVLRIITEDSLNVRRSLRRRHPEPPPEAEADSVALFGHRIGS